MKLYHLTDKEHLSSILEKGILPKCGKNTQMVERGIGNYIFLTTKKDLEVWSFFLNKHYVIEVEVGNVRRRNYSGYSEYYTDDKISPDNILNHYEFYPSKITKHTKDVLLDYIDFMQFTCDEYLDCNPSSKRKQDVDNRKSITDTLYVFAANPVYYNQYFKNSKELYQTHLEYYGNALKQKLEKEVSNPIKKNINIFLSYLEKCF